MIIVTSNCSMSSQGYIRGDEFVLSRDWFLFAVQAIKENQLNRETLDNCIELENRFKGASIIIDSLQFENERYREINIKLNEIKDRQIEKANDLIINLTEDISKKNEKIDGLRKKNWRLLKWVFGLTGISFIEGFIIYLII